MHDQTPAHPNQAEGERATVEADLREQDQDAPSGDAPTVQDRTRATSQAEGDREPAM